MSYQWNSLDSGILRRNKTETKQEQLLVFGYSCKIFRDDEKALEIDQGKHLIPWMGNDNLKIDRYDCRGALFDLKKFEAGKEGYDATGWLDQNDADRKLEELCDQERYYSLIINEEEEEMYKEEEAKRKLTNAFHYNYGTNDMPTVTQATEGIPTVPEKEEEEQPYVPSPILDVPIDIEIPKTLKEYARIEKTALFVCEQGLQMQILIKAKQANNPQFNFLSASDPLHKFYQHLSAAFKSGHYKPQCDKKTAETNTSASNDDTDQEDTEYLHPSLLSSNKWNEQPANFPSIPSIPYRPSADCAYSQLVNRIQSYSSQSTDSQSNADTDLAAAVVAAAGGGLQSIGTTNVLDNNGGNSGGGENYSISSEQHYYYVQQWNEYWKQYMQGNEQSAFLNLPPEVQNYIQQLQQQMAWAQYSQQQQPNSVPSTKTNVDNSYAQIVSNLNKEGGNPYTANMPQLPPPPPAELQRKEEEIVEQKHLEVDKIKKTKPSLLSLAAAYGSDSECSDNENTEDTETPSIINEIVSKATYSLPPDNMRLVIDKMAEYVTINGAKFEEIIKKKNDPRFSFLTSEHEYFKYYKNKLKEHAERQREERNKENKESVEKKEPKQKKVIAPVSFSIKKPKEEPTKEIKSALPIEDSSDEEESIPSTNMKTLVETNFLKDTNNIQKTLNKITSSNQPEWIQSMELPESASNSTPSTPPTPPPPPSINESVSSPPSRWNLYSPSIDTLRTSFRHLSKSKSRSPPMKKEKPPTIDMFDVGDVKNKKLKEHLKNDDDHMLMRLIELENNERMKESDEKEKALQLERKKKAAMFLKMKSETISNRKLSSPTKPRTPTPPLIGNIDSHNRNKRSRSRSTEENKKIDKKIKRNDINDNNSIVTSKSNRDVDNSRSCDRKKDKKKKKDRDRDRSRSSQARSKAITNCDDSHDNDDDQCVVQEEMNNKKEKSKKKSHKTKHSHNHKKKSKKHKKSRSRSKSKSLSRSESKSKHRSHDTSSSSSSSHRHTTDRTKKNSRSRSKSTCSHISINDSS